MNPRMKKMAIGLGIVFGGLLAFNVIKTLLIKRFFATYEPPAVTVSSVTVTTRAWRPNIDAIGNIEAINGVEVNSEASGKIVSVHFDSGQFVLKEAPLIDIDDRVEQATLQFNQAELALQEINYKRQTDLFKRGATPGSSVDEAHAKLLQAQANVDKTQALISQKHVKAPFAGRLGIRQVNLGQFVIPGQTDIVTLQSLDPLHLKFYLPEQRLPLLHLNQPILFSVDQTPNVLFKGIISAINAKVDTNTHNIEIEAIFPNCPAKLKDPRNASLIQIKQHPFTKKPLYLCNTQLNTNAGVTDFQFIPGMFAAIEVEEPAIPNLVVIPSTAISYSLYGDSVFLIEKDKEHPTDANGQEVLRVKRIFVKTGDQKGNYTVIKSGLKPGQLIVSSGELKLQDGTRIAVNNEIKLPDFDTIKQLGQ